MWLGLQHKWLLAGQMLSQALTGRKGSEPLPCFPYGLCMDEDLLPADRARGSLPSYPRFVPGLLGRGLLQ